MHAYLFTKLLTCNQSANANISLLFPKEEFSQIENWLSATMCRKKVLLRSNEQMLVGIVFQTTQCNQQTIILQDRRDATIVMHGKMNSMVF
jgi:hypothetical protein